MVRCTCVGVLLCAQLVLFTGCAGLKMDSRQIGACYRKDAIPQGTGVAIRMYDSFAAGEKIGDRDARELFALALAQELKDAQVFPSITVLPVGSAATTKEPPLLLEVTITRIGRQGWTSRSMSNAVSAFSIAGRLVDTEMDLVLRHFDDTRLAQGGLLGHGGLAAASEEDMQKQLMEWVAQDTIAMVR